MRGVSIAFMLLALAALAVNGAGIPRRIPGVWAKVREAVREARTWDGSGFRISSDHLNDMRRMVRRGVAPGAELALVPETKGRLDSVERSTHLAAAFERLPGRVESRRAVRDARLRRAPAAVGLGARPRRRPSRDGIRKDGRNACVGIVVAGGAAARDHGRRPETGVAAT